MCKVIAIVNQKGGVAKTTTTVNLGIGLVREGKKVLLIDADSQGSLSSSLGVEEPDELDVTLSTIMGKVINEEDYGKREGVIVHEEGVSFLPCNIELSGLEVTLVNTMRREYILKEYITSVRNLYDYILIDCNSSLGMVTMNALTAADSVIIPIEAAYLSVKGLQQLITTLGRTKKYLNPNLGIEGIVFTKMVGRTNYAKEIKSMVEEIYGKNVRVFGAVIPHSVRAAETSAEGVSIFSSMTQEEKLRRRIRSSQRRCLQMNKSNSASKIKMKSFDDLFGTNENLEQANANGGEIREIPLASLHTFRNHPFQIHEDKLEEMVESVRQYGVLVPGIARMRPQGGYEIIAGHTRKAACELAGLDTMPMFIRNLNDDEATIVMVDSNIQREDIFPSEKARAYSMRYYAMKHQGIKGDKGSSLDIMSEETGENAKKIQRYIRLAKLSDELLDFVDRKKIGFIQGVDLSYLNEEQQQWVLDIILDRNIFPNIEQSARLKASCRENMLTQEEVRNIMLPEQVLAKPRKVTFKADRLDDYFDEGYTEEKITEVIINLLDEWKKRGERA